ncbi:MAG TPA: SpoIIE family protein phosphatase [Vicinamibacterales bacterium]|nr:SpoIIE family protein phosphatase [Vicinamibacterales bacterium]
MSTAEDIRALFDRVRDAYQRFDPKALSANYTDDCSVESPIGGRVEGRAGVEHIARITFDAFPDFRVEIEETLVIGDRVVVTLTIHGTDTGGLFGFPPTGRRIRVPSVFLLTIRGGQIAHERRTYDFSGFLLQLTGVGSAIASARLYQGILQHAQTEREVRVAAEIQRALLPAQRYRSESVDIAAASVPCRAIGGDFFDYFELAGGAVGFVVADVSGKGPPAALLTAVLQGILAVHAYGSDSPATTIARVNQALARRAIEARFATMFYGVVEIDGRLRYCNAGHNPPAIISASGCRRLDVGGLMVGAFKDATFEEGAVRLARGDTLVAFSDGITEAVDRGGAEFGDERLIATVAEVNELELPALVDAVFDRVRDFTTDAPQGDDMTALALRYVGKATAETAESAEQF